MAKRLNNEKIEQQLNDIQELSGRLRKNEALAYLQGQQVMLELITDNPQLLYEDSVTIRIPELMAEYDIHM